MISLNSELNWRLIEKKWVKKDDWRYVSVGEECIEWLKSESYGMGLDNENEDDNEGDSVRWNSLSEKEEIEKWWKRENEVSV